MLQIKKQKQSVPFHKMPIKEQEELLAAHVQEIIKAAHAKGMSTYHGDGKDFYWLRPDGTKEIDPRDK
ncbi:MAG: hypothetical protein Q4D77_01305 [Peptostreptococcaceae bacterium]|nr:hypothetical protein [Peptostreptococcaceae bacterium]